ncbi:MAG: hypothetical protein A2252_00565 [Elusimicrobia bacterium RIFOXYA2_FULL_39_19]|nr:MAG: hypothetical protein A2252_00565 [Elusimicrobia bacterium RIFOXYA2_FULL_39_19]
MAEQKLPFRRKVYYWLVVIFWNAAGLMSFKMAQKIGACAGHLAFLIVGRYRKVAYTNLKSIFPEKTEIEIRSLTKRIFINQGKNFFEFLAFRKLTPENITRISQIKGKENFDEAFSRKKGVLMIAAHFSNWELLGVVLAYAGIPMNVIAKKLYIEKLDEMLIRSRESMGMKIIKRGEGDSSLGIIRALKKNQCLAMLVDQNIKSVPGVDINFFGKKAFTPSGLASLALKTGAPVLAVFIVREKDDTFTVEVSKKVELIKTGNEQEDILQNTQKFSDITEEYIRKYPDQWVWFHKRWNN